MAHAVVQQLTRFQLTQCILQSLCESSVSCYGDVVPMNILATYYILVSCSLMSCYSCKDGYIISAYWKNQQ